MDGSRFGDYVKQLRKKYKISSRDLSTSAGKAITYVSQLERGLIKKPDYNTCFKLLELLHVEQKQIELVLSNFEIISPEKELAELEWQIERAENNMVEQEADPVAYAERNLRWLLNDETDFVRGKNKELHSTLDILIDKDVSRADTLISNIISLTRNKESFSFLLRLFEHDYSNMHKDELDTLLNIINNTIRMGDKGND